MRVNVRASESRGGGGGERRACLRLGCCCRGDCGRGVRRDWRQGPGDRVLSPTWVPGAPSCRGRPGVTGTWQDRDREGLECDGTTG